MSRPIEVSKGRFVNLSGEPPTPQELLQNDVRKLIVKAKLKYAALSIEIGITQSLISCQEFREHPYHSYRGKKVTRNSFGTDRPYGRVDEERMRFHLIGTIWVAWLKGMRKNPVVNNKGDARTPFVDFAAAVMGLIEIGKVEDYLEQYQSYRQATLDGRTYQDWKDERDRARAFRVQSIVPLKSASKTKCKKVLVGRLSGGWLAKNRSENRGRIPQGEGSLIFI